MYVTDAFAVKKRKIQYSSSEYQCDLTSLFLYKYTLKFMPIITDFVLCHNKASFKLKGQI